MSNAWNTLPVLDDKAYQILIPSAARTETTGSTVTRRSLWTEGTGSLVPIVVANWIIFTNEQEPEGSCFGVAFENKPAYNLGESTLLTATRGSLPEGDTEADVECPLEFYDCLSSPTDAQQRYFDTLRSAHPTVSFKVKADEVSMFLKDLEGERGSGVHRPATSARYGLDDDEDMAAGFARARFEPIAKKLDDFLTDKAVEAVYEAVRGASEVGLRAVIARKSGRYLLPFDEMGRNSVIRWDD